MMIAKKIRLTILRVTPPTRRKGNHRVHLNQRAHLHLHHHRSERVGAAEKVAATVTAIAAIFVLKPFEPKLRRNVQRLIMIPSILLVMMMMTMKVIPRLERRRRVANPKKPKKKRNCLPYPSNSSRITHVACHIIPC
jgi:hypothetical protein